MKRNFNIRPAFVFIHRWAGLFLALFLIIEGITGSLLAFRSDLSRILDPSMVAAPQYKGAKIIPPAELAMIVDKQLLPNARTSYFFPSGETGQQIIRVGARINPQTHKPYEISSGIVIVNPWSGKIIDKRPFERYSKNWWQNIMPFVYQLHTNLALKNPGSMFLGIVALIWSIDCFTSIILTLPTTVTRFIPRWLKSWFIKLPTTSVFRINYDLHRAGSLWAWAFLFIFAWSSVELTLYPVYEAVTKTLFDYESPIETFLKLPKHNPEIEPKLNWQQAEQQGNIIINDLGKKDGYKIVAPKTFAYFAANGIYSYEVETTKKFPNFKNVSIYIDADTGKLYKEWKTSGEHLGNTISFWLRSLHLINDPLDNLLYRWFVFVFGIVLSVISATGVYIWWYKRNARKSISNKFQKPIK